jgi:ribosomal protein S18 acetylase RimI-like enzyme
VTDRTPNSVAPSIRPLGPRETVHLERLVIELQDAERALDGRLLPGAEMAPAYAAELVRRTGAGTGTILVAEVDGELVGFAALQHRVRSEELDEPPGEHALVSDLVVAASHRGRGIGRALLDFAVEEARARQATEVRVAVLARNEPARSLYVAAGFAPYLEILSRRL